MYVYTHTLHMVVAMATGHCISLAPVAPPNSSANPILQPNKNWFLNSLRTALKSYFSPTVTAYNNVKRSALTLYTGCVHVHVLLLYDVCH